MHPGKRSCCGESVPLLQRARAHCQWSISGRVQIAGRLGGQAFAAEAVSTRGASAECWQPKRAQATAREFL